MGSDLASMMLSEFNRHLKTLAEAVPRFRDKKILVLGDVMLDRFVWGSVSRISPEAPVPVVEIRKETTCLGGAANVAFNVKDLGGVPLPLSVVGDDAEGQQLRARFRELRVSAGGIVPVKERSTSVKTRIIAHHQQICRTDREETSPLPTEVQRKILEWFRAHIDGVDAVVVSDYAKGLVSPRLLKHVLPAARSAQKIVCVDPKVRDFDVYRPATVITPNLAEAEHAAGMKIVDRKSLLRAGKMILRQTGIPYLLITRGEHGMTLFERHANATDIPTVAREVYDVTGAGDTVLSVLCLGLVSGLSMLQAAILANIAAGVVVAKLGTASVSPDELIEAIHRASEFKE